MYPSVSLAGAACIAETDREKRGHLRCGCITVRRRQGPGQGQSQVSGSISAEMWADPRVGLSVFRKDKKRFTDYWKLKRGRRCCVLHRAGAGKVLNDYKGDDRKEKKPADE